MAKGERITYKDLHRWLGHDADNVRCGLVRGGKRILGCGKSGRTKGYWYKSKKFGTISTVYLCPVCSKKVK